MDRQSLLVCHTSCLFVCSFVCLFVCLFVRSLFCMYISVFILPCSLDSTGRKMRAIYDYDPVEDSPNGPEAAIVSCCMTGGGGGGNTCPC